MQNLVIDIAQIEEWQVLNDRSELEKLFGKAQSTIVNGAAVELVRNTGGQTARFEIIDNLSDLKHYRQQVMKYIE